MKPSGYILHEGPSLLDGAPIVAIATMESANPKTGNMVQTWILRADVSPTDAVRSGADASVCGNCAQRPALGGACYVRVTHAPTQVWRKYKRGGYAPLAYPVDCDDRARNKLSEIGAGRRIRLGAYGDPAAVPAHIWETLVRDATGHTGYTHQWMSDAIGEGQRRRITALCMASADSETEADMARSIGLRTFRMRSSHEPLRPQEFVCPASEEAGKRRTCSECGACNGSAKPSAASVVIIVHGIKTARFNQSTFQE
jgi:hypothetical protein